MAEVTALRKHPCPECGGDAEWNAAKQALVCPYCGTVLPWSGGEDPMGASIVEHDLVEALASETCTCLLGDFTWDQALTALPRFQTSDNPRLPFKVLDLYAKADALEAQVVEACAE